MFFYIGYVSCFLAALKFQTLVWEWLRIPRLTNTSACLSYRHFQVTQAAWIKEGWVYLPVCWCQSVSVCLSILSVRLQVCPSILIQKSVSYRPCKVLNNCCRRWCVYELWVIPSSVSSDACRSSRLKLEPTDSVTEGDCGSLGELPIVGDNKGGDGHSWRDFSIAFTQALE